MIPGKGETQKELFQRFFLKFILIRMLRLDMIYQSQPRY